MTIPSPASGAAVVLERLHRSFGPVVAVDDLDLAIEPGEFITLLGPSGSGKTTTLMMIAGFDYPTSGEIYIDRRPIVGVPPHKRNLGMVFQNYALFPHMTVAENIGFALKQRRVSKAETARSVAESLEIVRLRGYEGRYPRQLSGGQQQRVALARAIIFKPRVLLMDEPLSALDKQLREELQLEIKRLHRQLGITFIYVTHDQREALILSDRVAVMNAGRLEQVGRPSDLYDRPANRFVASFVGESNFLAGTVVTVDGGVATVGVGGSTVQVGSRSSLTAGTSVVLAIRPEKLAFAGSNPHATTAGVNVLDTVVREVSFAGDMHRYVLELDGGTTILVKQQYRFGLERRIPGERALVEWHIEDTMVV